MCPLDSSPIWIIPDAEALRLVNDANFVVKLLDSLEGGLARPAELAPTCERGDAAEGYRRKSVQGDRGGSSDAATAVPDGNPDGVG